VDRKFKATAHRLLEEKLFEKVKVFGYDRWDGGWFKATIRRGWSDACCTSHESCVEEALSLAFQCRCCSFEGGCAFNRGVADFSGCQAHRSNKEKPFDMDQARVLLLSRGWFRIINNRPDVTRYMQDPSDPHVQISYKQGSDDDGNQDILHEYLRRVEETIDEEVSYEMIPSSFRKFYGLGGEMPSRQFLRSLFILFGDRATANTEGKKPSISMIKSLIDVPRHSSRFCRMKMYVRFYTTDNGPIEICLQSKHSI